MRYFDRSDVARLLTVEACVENMREAMRALSDGRTVQIPRAVTTLSERRMLGVMAGGLGVGQIFGAKILSVFHDNLANGLSSHQGLVLVFDPTTGAPICAADAGAITAVRTAATSAVATDALARTDARRLTILGCGEQAHGHAHAINLVRRIESIRIWGRSPNRARLLAERLADELRLSVKADESIERAIADADIVCTVTAAQEPILLGRWIRPGMHINAVGSSVAGAAEVDNELVAKARFIVDCRENVMRAGGEFLRAKAAGVIGDDHIVAEIGEVLSGRAVGRRNARDITLYKSLGHIAQDLAAVGAIAASPTARVSQQELLRPS